MKHSTHFWRKVLISGFGAYVFLTAFLLLLGQFEILGTGYTFDEILLVSVVASLSFFITGWGISASIRKAVVVTFVTLFVGVPLGYFVLVPLNNWLIDWLFSSTSLRLSGSVSWVWFLLGPILTVELQIDQIFRQKRWIALLAGTGLILILTYCVELFTANEGQTTDLTLKRILIYTPLVWGGIVAFVNFRFVDSGGQHD